MKLPGAQPFVRSLALLACLALTGCDHYFAASGVVTGHGGALGTWSSTPEGCSRDPFDGLPASESSSVVTLLWDDPGIRDPLRDLHRPTAPDAPLRLEIARTPESGYTMQLNTVKTQGNRFDSHTCSRLIVDTRETPKAIPEGRPTLAGTVRFDCPTEGGHVTADVHFKRCEY